MLGSKLASMAGQAFGLEIEGLSHEDQHYEIAKQYVRFAAAAARRAALAQAKMPPRDAAKTAFVEAAKQLAPGILTFSGKMAPTPSAYSSPYYQPYSGGSQRTGRWVRRGNRIIIYGA